MSTHRGFTLVELLIGLVVLSILVAIAAPSFSTAMAQQRLRQASNELRSTVAIARSEAVKRNGQVRLLPRNGGWSNGWCVESDPSASACSSAPLSERVMQSNLTITGVDGFTSVNVNSWGRPTAGSLEFEFETEATGATCNLCLTLLSDGRVVTESGDCDAATAGTWRDACS